MDTPSKTREAQLRDGRPSRGRAWKKIAALGGAGVVALVALGLVGRSRAAHAAARRVAELRGEWAALEGCTLGAPLADGETPSSRFRSIQLTVLGTPRDARARDHEAPWPARCANFATRVAERSAAAPADASDLVTSSNALAKDMRADTDAMADLGKLIDQVWKDAKTAGLSAPPGDPGSAPKPTHAILSEDSLHTPSGFTGDFALSSVKPDPSATSNLRFLIDDHGLTTGPVVCSVSGTPTTLACMRFGSEDPIRSLGLSLLGTTDPGVHPWIFAGDRGQLGVYRPSGRAALKGEPVWGASVGADGTAWLLVHPKEGGVSDLRLLHAPYSGDVPPGVLVASGNEITSPADATLAWDWLILWSGPHAQYPRHLVAHHVLANGGVGPAIDIGDAASLEPAGLADTRPRFSACRSGNNVAVRVHGAHANAVTFYTGTAWTAPVALATSGGDMLCEGNEAVVTEVADTRGGDGASPAVEQSRCNASGCTVSHVALNDLLAGTDVMPAKNARGSGSFAAAELNGKLMLVWNAGALGGLRMRLASIDRLKATPDVLIADTRADDAKSAVVDLHVFSAAEAAVLFVKAADGAHVFSVDGAGAMVPLHVQL